VHWFCFPAVVPASPLTAPRAACTAEEYLGAHAAEVLAAAAEAHMADPREVFVVALARNGAAPRVLTVAEADAQLLLPDRTAPQPDAAARLGPGGDLLLAIADHSGLAGAAGSTLRNVAALAACRYGALHFAALCLRVDRAAAGEPARAARSIVVEVTVPEGAYAAGAFGGGGWETNGKGKPGPRMVDLGSQMDPVALAEGSVDLNLKLMRWRLMPSLDLEGVAAQRCLLLGSGTLGCNVARTLMSWGVRAITMVDNGRVSYSNPVRQSLFTHADCADGGRPKALAAAERLREIFPSMEANGVQLTIPMAGHSVGAPGSPQYAETARDHDTLRELIETHDIVFLLTDSRESRWLPTLIARDTCTPLINVALGFDSYVVMRHGVDGPGAEAGTSASLPSSSSEISSAAATLSSTPTSSTASSPSPPRAPDSLGTDRGHGCYFCNDCAAPLDSLSSRTLDQQCTVTRPGLSYVASANAVELMVTVLNHPDKWLAPAAEATPTTTRTEYPLGLAAQQLRGFLTHQHTAVVATVRSDRCTACSPAVVAAYRADRFGVVARACNEHDYLENLTGLTTLFAEADAAFAAIEAVSDDEDDW
jgi:ubiquitin-like modifier-activating enzyme ATG7